MSGALPHIFESSTSRSSLLIMFPSARPIAILTCSLLLAACAPARPAPGNAISSSAMQLEQQSGIGYVTRVHERDGRQMIDVDFIQWFTSDQAASAMKQDDPDCDAQDEAGCQPPNGFYVRNAVQNSVTLPLADDVRIEMLSLDPSKLNVKQDVSIDEFESALRLPGDRVVERFRFVPFWVQQEDGQVSAIREQYVP